MVSAAAPVPPRRGPVRGDLARPRVRPLPRRPRALARARRRSTPPAASRCSTSAPAPAASRSTLARARPPGDRARARRRAAGGAAERAAGLAVEADRRRRPRASSSTRRDFALCLVPMQTVQLLGGPRAALAFLRARRAHLRAGRRARVRARRRRSSPSTPPPASSGSIPELARLEGVLYSSARYACRVGPRRIRIERERRIEPGEPAARAEAAAAEPPERELIDLDRLTAAQLAAGGPARRTARRWRSRTVAPTEQHTASTVVILGA